MTYEITHVSIVSLLRTIPLMFLILGALIGVYTFYIKPSKTVINLNKKAKLISYLIFSILYPIIISGAIVVLGIVYNIMTSWIKGIEIILK